MKTNLFPIVILSGGLATRLRPLTETLPKALIPINGEAFVAHQLRLLSKQGLQKVVMCIGYLGEQIKDYVGDGSQFGVHVTYVFDGPKLLGTAGAIKRALPLLPDNFFVLNGDSYLACDYLSVQNEFKAKNKLGLMTVFYNQSRWDNSNVEFVDDEIIAYDKQNRTQHMQHIDYGLTVFNKKAFAEVPDNVAVDLGPIYQSLLQKKQLAGCEIKQRFYENGSFSGITELENYLK